MSRTLRNYLKMISTIQWLTIFCVSLFLAFFNSFGNSVLQNDGWGTLANGINETSLVRFLIVFLLFVLISFLFVFIGIFINTKNVSQNAVLIRVSLFFQSYKKTFLFLLCFWGIILIPFFPVVSGWDFVASVREMTQHRAGLPNINIFDVYPIAHYLTDRTTSLLSNQHGAYLTILYGSVVKYSWISMHSYLPAYILLGIIHFGFALFSYTYAINYFNKLVSNVFLKVVATFLIIFNPVIILSTISLAKNPLFVSSFVLFFTLSVQLFETQGAVNKNWKILMTVAITVGMIAVKWAFIFYAILSAIYLIYFWRVSKRDIFKTIVLPIFILKVFLLLLIHQGVVIQDDPIEGKSLQIQQVARYVNKHKSGLTAEQYNALNKIFVVKNIGNLYTPVFSDPVKSSSYGKFVDPSKLGYRYETVKASDWNSFNKVWIQLMEKDPSVFMDATIAQVGSYFVPSQVPRMVDYTTTLPIDVVGQGYGSLSGAKWTWHIYHNSIRQDATNKFITWFNNKIFGMPLHGNFWIFVFILLLPAFLSSISKFLLILPVLLQVAIVVLSPVANSERYTLGILAIMPFVILLLGVKNFIVKR